MTSQWNWGAELFEIFPTFDLQDHRGPLRAGGRVVPWSPSDHTAVGKVSALHEHSPHDGSQCGWGYFGLRTKAKIRSDFKLK